MQIQEYQARKKKVEFTKDFWGFTGDRVQLDEKRF